MKTFSDSDFEDTIVIAANDILTTPMVHSTLDNTDPDSQTIAITNVSTVNGSLL